MDKRCGTCAHSRFERHATSGYCQIMRDEYPEFEGASELPICRVSGVNCWLWKPDDSLIRIADALAEIYEDIEAQGGHCVLLVKPKDDSNG